MDYQASRKRVTAIVPAFNEGAQIGRVLDVLQHYPGFHSIIVVDDGSQDDTAEIAEQYDARVLRHETNHGKGRAMDLGVRHAQGDIVMFFDADIVGLTHETIDEIIAPVLRGEVDMFIAMRNRKIYALNFLLTIIPLLGGERALTKQLWQTVPDTYKYRFKIEAALNFYAKYYGNGFRFKVFGELGQTVKEAKYGFWRGFRARIKMFYEVALAQLELELSDVPHTVKSGRIALVSAVVSFAGAMLGAAAMLIAYGNIQELLILRMSGATIPRQILAAFGTLLIVTNGAVFVLQARRARLILARFSGKRQQAFE